MITITKGIARAETLEGCKRSMPAAKLISKITPPQLDLVLPTGVKMLVQKHDQLMVVYEIKPGAHRVKWQDVDVANAKRRTLAMPYVLLLIPFAYVDGKILPYPVFVECYYRNEPLMEADDKLFFPALLNTGYWSGLTLDSWICTTGIDILAKTNYIQDNTRRLWKTIALLRDYFSAATFNWEWKYNWQSYINWDKADPRITNLDTWEKETANDPSFVLGVEWMPAKRNLKETINSTLDKINSKLRPKITSDYLHSIIINQGNHENIQAKVPVLW